MVRRYFWLQGLLRLHLQSGQLGPSLRAVPQFGRGTRLVSNELLALLVIVG
jgi:hypothetical protein